METNKRLLHIFKEYKNALLLVIKMGVQYLRSVFQNTSSYIKKYIFWANKYVTMSSLVILLLCVDLIQQHSQITPTF